MIIKHLRRQLRKLGYSRPVLGRLRAAASPMMLIDLLAILPFYLPFIDADLRFLRSLRLLRIFRLAKIARYSNALQTLGRVLGNHKVELAATGFVMLILLILSSTLMYYAENDAQPQAFSSVPASMWWAVATMTTVGYGDMCPVTPLGKVLGSFIAILGIGCSPSQQAFSPGASPPKCANAASLPSARIAAKN
ncbi:MAG: ion transporter [Planctomycetaceae bacterium]|nr:potassium channel family protein [Planctomycetaceae bacterium]